MPPPFELPAALTTGQGTRLIMSRWCVELEAERQRPGKAPKVERVGHKAGAMLDQLLFWSTRDGAVSGGWIYKSFRHWYDECCLTRREAQCATAKLSEMGLIETDVRHAPGSGAPTMHYRIHWDHLRAAIDRLMAYPPGLDAPQETPDPLRHSVHSNAPNVHSNAPNVHSLTDSSRQSLKDPSLSPTADTPVPEGRREYGTNPRALGTNPRALGTNPRAQAAITTEPATLEASGTVTTRARAPLPAPVASAEPAPLSPAPTVGIWSDAAPLELREDTSLPWMPAYTRSQSEDTSIAQALRELPGPVRMALRREAVESLHADGLPYTLLSACQVEQRMLVLFAARLAELAPDEARE